MKKKALMSVLVMFMVVVCMLPACAPKAAAPMGPLQVVSFSVDRKIVAGDECPVINFEVANAKSIIITWDGEKVMEIEATVPGTPSASLQPRHGQVYALTETQPGVEPHYSPGIYPAGFNGST